MRSRVEVVADVTDDGRPVLARLHADGALAARATGPGTVHLVGTAAGPLGGDVVEITVVVRDGARLTLAGVAATLALPGGTGATAVWDVGVEVGRGGHLECAPQPLVVCAGARLRTTTRVRVADGGGLDLLEQVVLGRHGEPGGQWHGRLVADLGTTAALRQTQASDVVAAGPCPPGAGPARTVLSRLLTGPAADGVPAPGVHGGAVACPVPGGGVLLTATGQDLTGALDDLEALTAPLAEPRPAA